MGNSIRHFAHSTLLLLPLGLAAVQEPKGVGLGDPIQGQTLFAQKSCVKCHAVRGAGGRIGPDLGRKAARNSYYEIASVMWNHSQGMTGKMAEYRITPPTFRDQELSDLIAFLYFLNYFDEPGDPRVGKTLFTGKHCIRCHKVGGEGGETGPPLDALNRGVSPLSIGQALWNHGPAMVSAIEASGLEVPKFEGNEIIDLIAYIRIHGTRQSARRFQSPGDPEKGRAVFQAKGCSACHEIFGEEPGVGPDLGRAELRGSVTQIAGRMWNHWPEMSRTMQKVGMSVPQFEGDELLDLFAFVYIARYQGQEGLPDRGRAVFEGKGCSVCHGAEGKGLVGPDLQRATTGQSKESIMQSMWNHAPGMGAVLEAQNLSWARLSAQELADLLAFLSRGWPVPGPTAEQAK
jgi:mono/diheme cytochrome c family protein